MITHGSTFSGIGAPEVAAEMLGWQNAFHCEINPFGREVLDYYFPNAESYEDITKQDFSKWRGKITVLTGGFPCQPFSYAGKRRGSEDDRYLWPFMLKCIQEVRPTWFVGENVAGITTMVFPGEDVKVGSGATLFDQTDYIRRDERYVIEEICQQLEDCGYSVQPMLIPACAVGAPHRRDRVFFIAHRNSVGDTTDGLSEGQHDGNEPCGQSGEIRQPGGTSGSSGSRQSEIHVNATNSTSNGRNGCALNDRQERSDNCDGGRQCEEEDTDGFGLRSEFGTDGEILHAPDTQCHRGREVHQPLQPQLADGTEPISNGRKSDVADTRCTELQAGLDERSNGITDRETSGRCGRGSCGEDGNAKDTMHSGLMGREHDEQGSERNIGDTCPGGAEWLRSKEGVRYLLPTERWRTFPTVSPVYRGNDGLPFDVDHLTIPFSRWKKESLKAYGNAIVVQVMYRIFEAIDKIEKDNK